MWKKAIFSLIIFLGLIGIFAFSDKEREPEPEYSLGAFPSSYQYCRKMTMTAGGTSGGVATTTTAGFALVATSTISTLAATSSAGHIYETSTASGTTTPVDITITNGTDCLSDSGSTIDFYFEKYVETTGEFVLWAEASDISSTSAKTVLMYYGYPDNSATDVSNEAGVFGALGEVGVWDLSENPAGSAPQLKDSRGTLDGTSVGSMTSGDSVTGQIGGALDLDGVNDGVSINDHASLDVTRISYGIWVYKKANFGWWGSLFGRQRGTSYADLWLLLYEDGSNDLMTGLLYTTSAVSTTPKPNTTLETNQWVHYITTYDGATVSLYRNGVLYGSIAQTGNIPSESTKLCIGIGANDGSLNCNSEAVEVIIDDARFYNRGLHSMDVLTIYNNTVNSALFWTIGNEETQGSSPTPSGIQNLIFFE